MRRQNVAPTATVWGPQVATRQSVEMIEGVRLRLRLIEPDDAAYVYGLRTDPAYNAHLSAVQGTADDQRRWIESYKAREAALHELYYVIERRDGVPCGLVRLYDISAEGFTWGSWILDTNKPQKAALESALLSFGIGFEHLDLPAAYVDVRKNNARAISIYERLGMTEIRRDDQDIFYRFDRTRFLADRAGLLAIVEGEIAA